MTRYIRYRGTHVNRRGIKPGVFALVNGLVRDGRLSESELSWWREANSWYESRYTDPSNTDPSVYDPLLNPQATSWFRADAEHLIERIGEYLEVLDTYGIEHERTESSNPGRIIFEDDVQVVVVPSAHSGCA
ncbi:hypothetical protein [Microbacterium karelineae]|uniref:hypothetical protein n=1 Tax=Microbacterium karelineae TaxID=2654283 RepID=UPI0018D2DDEB|nr:hypothetical protein [Microbacterium karelineae]